MTRQGVLIEEEEGGTSYLTDADSDEARSHRPLQAVACTRRNDFGPRAGQKVFTMPRRHATRRRAYPGPVRRPSGLQPARGGALPRQRAPADGTTVPLHHAPGTGQRTRADQQRRASDAQAQDRLARRHQPPRDVATGVHAAHGRAGTAAAHAVHFSLAAMASTLGMRPTQSTKRKQAGTDQE